LTANFGVVHGQAVGLMLPTVVRFNAHDPVAREHYLDLAAAAGLCRRNEDPRAASEALATRIEFLLNAAGIPRTLAEFGVNKTHLQKLADEASKQWTGTFNPRALGPADCASLYATALETRGDGWGGGERRRGSLRLEKGELA
jgi:alcohol dehydrogenase